MVTRFETDIPSTFYNDYKKKLKDKNITVGVNFAKKTLYFLVTNSKEAMLLKLKGNEAFKEWLN